MSTKTPLAKLEEEAGAAAADLREARQRQLAYADRQRSLGARRLELAADGKQFSPEGEPKSGTEAAKVVAEIEADPPAFDLIVAAATGRAGRAQAAVRGYQQTNARELLEGLAEPAEAAVDEIRDALARLQAGLIAYTKAETAIVRVVNAVGLDGRDVPTDPAIERISKLVRELSMRDLEPPYSRSITPRPGERPPFVANGDRSGYVSIDNASPEELLAAGLGHLVRGVAA
ncbi:MAG: hypothetical protein H0W09_02100 [Solirubrobacterales bacterium]|nr:hypothetical protein [Solirubrobacterales bacterium]